MQLFEQNSPCGIKYYRLTMRQTPFKMITQLAQHFSSKVSRNLSEDLFQDWQPCVCAF